MFYPHVAGELNKKRFLNYNDWGKPISWLQIGH